MEVGYKKEFDEQIARFAFRFTCEHCVHFNEPNGDCVNRFPNRVHRLRYYNTAPRPRTIIFCKDFDLA